MEYIDWNNLIAKHFFNETKAGKEALLYVNDELINSLGEPFKVGVDDFIESVKAGPGWTTRSGLCQKALQACEGWRRRGLEYPPYISYLTFFVLAAVTDIDRAELLRNEEKKLRRDVKAIQLRILEKRNAVNLVKATQDFLLRLRSNPNNEQMDYLVKTFMRIIFKAIYIQNQEIVKVEINQPWKMCYEEGLKWLKTRETPPIQAKQAEKARRSYVYFCVPSADLLYRFYNI